MKKKPKKKTLRTRIPTKKSPVSGRKSAKKPIHVVARPRPVPEPYDTAMPSTHLQDIPHERFVRLQLLPVDGEEWRFVCDVILTSANKLLGTWPYFGLWGPIKREFLQDCWPCIIEDDGAINPGEQDDLYSSNFRQVEINVGTRIIFRQAFESGRRRDNAYAFSVATITELGARHVAPKLPQQIIPPQSNGDTN
jgi:hypothetical protein